MPRPRIALVVPSLLEGGGVPAVARFIKDSVIRDGQFDLKIVSLATSVRDNCSVRAARPWTWLQGVRTRTGVWDGLPFVHVGAAVTEFEFRRYQSREVLSRLLSDCNLIQVVGGGPAWGLTAVGQGKPVIAQVATRTLVERRLREKLERGPVAWWRWAMTRITDSLDDRGLQSVDVVLVENPWMYRYALEASAGWGTWVRYAPPGVDTLLFHPLVTRSQEMNESSYFLSVGRFDDPRKNVVMLLAAYERVRRSMTRAPLLRLAGLGDPGPGFWRKVQELGLQDFVSFQLRPTREELVALYQNAVCFALPSDEEGFGIVVVEAMACGVPVVATRCGGPDGIITNGVDGYLTESGNDHEMAERLTKLAIDIPANRAMGLAARHTAETRFSETAAGEMFLDTYRQLLAVSKT